VVRDLYHRFEVPTPTVRGRVDQRLFSFSGNGRVELWRTAWQDYRAHPWLGSGAGTYERAWLASSKSDFPVKDAHGLYIETLAELGPIGLLLLLGALLSPVVLTIRRGATPAVAGAAGAYGAYLLHAGIDWDWELAGVTAVALALGALLLVEGRPTEGRSRLPSAVRVATIVSAVVLSLFAAFAYVGNAAAGSAEDDLQANNFQSAASQAQRAERLMPWSTQPPVLLAEAYLGLGDLTAARSELRKALAKDRGDWRTWLDLALASKGRARRDALAEASRLYPRSPEIIAVRAGDGGQ
jgi:tetratricopeptide (TPR) repeat protein